MRRRAFIGASAALPFISASAGATPASDQPLEAIPLPKPQTSGGKPLITALNQRKTIRTISEEKLSTQVLSNMLWAAFGINRPDGRRTAPTAMNFQDIDIYVFLPQGVYLYDAPGNALKPILAGDHRAKTGTQDGVEKAPACLVYVTNLEKYTRGEPAAALAFANVHVGFIAQNVYLFAASEGLAAWFRASLDTDALASLMNLKPKQKVLYAQTVGHPA